MKKLIYTLALLLLVQTVSMCQWINVYNYPMDGMISSGSDLFTVGNNSLVFKSTNNGVNWTIDGGNATNPCSIASLNTNILVGGLGIWRTTNNGLNWIMYPNTGTRAYYALAVSGSTIYAGTNEATYKTLNGGANWSMLTSQIDSVHAIAASGSTIYLGTYSGLYASTNSGLSFVARNNGLSNLNINALAISGTNAFVGVGTPASIGGIYLSTNYGYNWTSVNNGIPTNQQVYVITISGTNIFASTSTGIYLSTNNGTNWTNKTQNMNNIGGIHMISIQNNYIFVGTANGLWRRLYSDIISGIENIPETVTNYSLSQNFPNPFNPSTKISYSIPKSELVTLKVYDILGKEVSTLLNEVHSPGTYSLDFNSKALTSGIYLYKLQAGNYIQTRRMLLIK